MVLVERRETHQEVSREVIGLHSTVQDAKWKVKSKKSGATGKAQIGERKLTGSSDLNCQPVVVEGFFGYVGLSTSRPT
jgi:hypothetical protein